ncbi:TonB family protein, partial [Thermosulfurimonas sp.]|uniref:TonB family protein n=1 Tax=Thermosulfurimonas sp. TaxID=2080236 RepID=UPI0025E061A0
FEVPLALEKEKNLTAEIRLRLSARGQLLDYQWIKHSGNPLFDRAAEAAIKAAAPYPAPGQPCTVRVIFTPRGLS